MSIVVTTYFLSNPENKLSTTSAFLAVLLEISNIFTLFSVERNGPKNIKIFFKNVLTDRRYWNKIGESTWAGSVSGH